MTHELPLIAFAWLAYGALHSALASLTAKQWVATHRPAMLPAYRLVFNIVALLTIPPVLWLTHRYPGAPVWIVPGWVSWPAAVLVISGVLWSTRWYDGATFLGLRQLRDHVGPDDEREAFRISPLHRHVRHPWYALGLLWLWTRNLNAAWLVASAVISIYLVIGSRLEESKLLRLYGETYARYRERVPGLVPVPGWYLKASEAKALETSARHSG